MRVRPLLQNGRGIGSFFASIARFLLPLLKKSAPVIKAVLKTPTVKKGLKKMKKAALKSALTTTAGVVSGDSVKQSSAKLKKDLKKIVSVAGKTSVKLAKEKLNISSSSKKGKKKKNTKRTSIFKGVKAG